MDLKHNKLRTKTTNLPIVQRIANHVIELASRSEQRVQLPTDLYSEEAIINFQQFCEGVRMPPAIVKCENGYATTIIQNTLKTRMTLTVTAPFKVEEFNDDNKINVNCYNDVKMKDMEVDDIFEENLMRLRLNHMNQEEQKCISELCQEYKDIFYCDQLPLSFTSQVKHFIC